MPGGKKAPTLLSRLSGDAKNAATADASVSAPPPSPNPAPVPPTPVPPADFPSAICAASAATMSITLPIRMSASFFRPMLTNLIITTTATDTIASGMTGSAA